MRKQDLSPSRQRLLVAVESHPGAHALVPPPIPESFPLKESAQPLYAAHEALVRLQSAIEKLPNPLLVTRTLERREAVQSSQIEGTESGVADLLEYEATGDPEGLPVDVEVTLNYVKALDYGLSAIRNRGMAALNDDLIKGLHRVLMSGVADYRDPPGEYRTIQNWIGGLRIYDARFVPPPADRIPAAMQELVRYLNYRQEGVGRTSVVLRTAIAHAQFETIHPFRDGNGRAGRLLMPLMLAAEGYAPIYLAGYLKRNQREYYDALLGVQLRDEWPEWVSFVAEAVAASCDESLLIAGRLTHLRENWQERLSGLRVDATANRMLDLLLGTPKLTARLASDALGVSFPAANDALDRLVKEGIVAAPGNKRNRVFVAQSIIDILNTNEPDQARNDLGMGGPKN